MEKGIKPATVAAILLAVGAVAAAQSANNKLFYAALRGTAADVRAALKKGANVNARVEGGYTALIFAASYNTNAEVIKVLLAAGSDVNARDEDGWTALMCAAGNNANVEVTKALLDAGSDVNARDEDGYTVLMWAAYGSKNPNVVKVLIEAGANKYGRDEDGWTALMSAACDNANAEVTKALLDAGSDVNARDEYGATALMWAAFGNKNPDVVKVLIEAGANKYAKAKDGKRAIDLLEIREDKDEFYGTDAYWKMRDLLLSTGRTSDDKKLARPYSLDSTMYKPLKQGIMTSAYGYRVSPISGQWKFHAGVDLAAPAGSNVFSCLPGKITVAKYDSVYGNYILITHYNGYSTLYAHLSAILVKVGDKVDGGKIIGKVGTTGASTGPHLHFEVRKNGKTENPATLIKLP